MNNGSGPLAFIVLIGAIVIGIPLAVWQHYKGKERDEARQEAKRILDDIKQKNAQQKRELEEEQRKTPYLMGYDACKAGIAMSKNPYNFLHTKDYAEWQRGWVQCKEDNKKGK